jgi:hypothetical protein
LRGTVHLIGDDVATSGVVQQELAVDYRVRTYCSALRLLERLPNETGPGCVILDVSSPGLAGPQLKADMAKAGSTLPFMFLTNWLQAFLRDRSTTGISSFHAAFCRCFHAMDSDGRKSDWQQKRTGKGLVRPTTTNRTAASPLIPAFVGSPKPTAC